MAAKKKSSSDYDGFEDDDNDADDDFDSDFDDSDEEASSSDPSAMRGRDWRDIERFREERELRKLIDDDLDFDDDEERSLRRRRA